MEPMDTDCIGQYQKIQDIPSTRDCEEVRHAVNLQDYQGILILN